MLPAYKPSLVSQVPPEKLWSLQLLPCRRSSRLLPPDPLGSLATHLLKGMPLPCLQALSDTTPQT